MSATQKPPAEYTTICKDYHSNKNGQDYKGCGQQIVMKQYPDLSWHPHDPVGTPHKHASGAQTTTTTQSGQKPSGTPAARRSDPGYYDNLKEIAEVDLQRANALLKEGWVVLRIVEKQGYVLQKEQPVQATQIVYILGRRASN